MGNPIDDNIVDNTVGAITPAVMRTTLHAITRDILTANANYYVNNVTGSDGNSGTLAQPFATLQHAWDFLAGSLDLSQFNLTINLASSGTPYTVNSGNYFIGGNTINILGAGSSTTKLDSINLASVFMPQSVNFDSVTIQSTSVNPAVVITCAGFWQFGAVTGDVVFGATPSQHIRTIGAAVAVEVSSAEITAAGANFAACDIGSSVATYGTITLVGTPFFNDAFVWVQDPLSAFYDFGTTFVGSATGKRFKLDGGIFSSTSPGGDSSGTFFPGSVAGTITNYGFYTGITNYSGTVAGLPAPISGAHAFVTDGNSSATGTIAAGGGTTTMPVYADGTHWRFG